MRFSAVLVVVFWAGSVSADPGHLIGVAGHDHLIALGAIGAAIAAGIWGALKGARDDDEADDEAAEPQEA